MKKVAKRDGRTSVTVSKDRIVVEHLTDHQSCNADEAIQHKTTFLLEGVTEQQIMEAAAKTWVIAARPKYAFKTAPLTAIPETIKVTELLGGSKKKAINQDKAIARAAKSAGVDADTLKKMIEGLKAQA